MLIICVFFVSIFELTVDLWVSYFQFIGTALFLGTIGILIFTKCLSLKGSLFIFKRFEPAVENEN